MTYENGTKLVLVTDYEDDDIDIHLLKGEVIEVIDYDCTDETYTLTIPFDDELESSGWAKYWVEDEKVFKVKEKKITNWKEQIKKVGKCLNSK